MSLTYKNGLVAQTADKAFKLKIGLRSQIRATAQRSEGQTRSFAEARRPRLRVSGHLVDPRMTFYSQFGWDRGKASVFDVWADYAIKPGLRIRAGQMKRPFAREFFMSTIDLTLVDRAITHAAFRHDRDIGVMLHSGIAKRDGVEYALGLYNGTGISMQPDSGDHRPEQIRPQFVGRVGYHSKGSDSYRQVDFKRDGVRGGIAFNVQIDPANERSGTAPATKAGVDGVVKFAGFSAMGAAYASSVGDTFSEQEANQYGGYLDVDYLVADKIVPALRYAYVARVDDADRQEAAFSTAYLLRKHRVKWTHEIGVLMDQDDDGWIPTVRGQSQLELNF